eukprot:2392155-Rhodomonas_salina.1
MVGQPRAMGAVRAARASRARSQRCLSGARQSAARLRTLLKNAPLHSTHTCPPPPTHTHTPHRHHTPAPCHTQLWRGPGPGRVTAALGRGGRCSVVDDGGRVMEPRLDVGDAADIGHAWGPCSPHKPRLPARGCVQVDCRVPVCTVAKGSE